MNIDPQTNANSRINYENKPILLFQSTGYEDSTSPSPHSESPRNGHSNQYYDYCQQQKAIKEDSNQKQKVPSEEPTENQKIENKKLDPTPSAIQITNKPIQNNKILIPKKNKSNKIPTNEKKLETTESVTQQLSTVVLNQSASSGSDIQDIRQPTRVSAKIQQLLNTLKVSFIMLQTELLFFSLNYNNYKAAKAKTFE